MTTEVKICGLKTHAAIDAAIDGGARYIGLVLFPKSPRHVTLPEAKELADYARGQAEVVVLTVDASSSTLAQIVDKVDPDFLQLHGHETSARVREVRMRFHKPVIKAVPVATAADVAASASHAGAADLILFDAKPPPGAAVPGGNGRAFDWSALDGVRGTMPFMLSGGLTAETVADAIAATGASAVDVSSGVESAPGVKDPELIRRFLRAVKAAKQT